MAKKEELLASFPTKQASLEFFSRHREYFSVGRFLFRNFQFREGKFSMRREDDTPSAIAKPLLKWIDFGGDGRVHSIFDLILQVAEERGEKGDFPWALKELERLMKEAGVDPSKEVDPSLFEKEEKVVLPPYSSFYIKKRLEDAQRAPEIFKELLSGLFRTCSDEEIERGKKLFRIGLAYPRKESHEDFPRLFIPEYDRELKAWGSYRYKRDADPKGLLRKKSKRVLFGGHLLPFFSPGPIIFSEGHSDTVVNNAKGLRCVTTGSATTPLRENIKELKGKALFIFYDLDEPGVKGCTARLLEAERYNRTVSEEERVIFKPVLWSRTMIDKKGQEVDMLSLEEEQRKYLENEGEEDLFESFKLSKWKVISSKPLKKGFDWIDFHQEFSGTDRYEAFLKNFRYL